LAAKKALPAEYGAVASEMVAVPAEAAVNRAVASAALMLASVPVKASSGPCQV
jgi:hypothetical protein